MFRHRAVVTGTGLKHMVGQVTDEDYDPDALYILDFHYREITEEQIAEVFSFDVD